VPSTFVRRTGASVRRAVGEAEIGASILFAMTERDRLFWRLQLAGWLAYAVAMALSRIGRFPLSYMIATKGLLALLGLAITSWMLRPIYRRLLPTNAPILRVVVVTAVASYVAAVLWTASDGALDLYLQRALLDPGRVAAGGFWYYFGGALYNAFTLLSWSVLYVGIKHQQALQAERERALRAESAANRARLDALRWQLNPHFLFNALNGISTLVVEGRAREAAAMIARLGDLLRGTLEQQSDEVTLATELELVRLYFDIEQARFGDRLALETAVDANAWQARVPVMLLQPLVENAVKHAIAPRERGGTIRIGATRVGAELELFVEDDGPGLSATDGAGIGLANVRERLRHLFGAGERLELTRSTLGGARAVVRLPYRE
jgi:two-component system, LytTR family, sensor kinase